MPLFSDGKKIHQTYEVERFLGEGAFAEVYRVRHRFLGRQAMKVFKMVGMTAEETEEMLGEAILLSKMGHPNIVRVFDANTIDTSRGMCGFFTMEYVAGGSLEQFWRSHGSKLIPIEKTVEIIRQVCRGLALAHSQNPPIIHRDVKPQNILVGYDDSGELRARLSDFGLAKRVNPLTMAATVKGTRCFKAPEAFRNIKSDSLSGDVWAVGMTLYLLLTDRLPFGDVSEADWGSPDFFNAPLIPPSRLNVLVNPQMDRIVLRAMAIDPTKRYPNAVRLLQDLDNWRPSSETGKQSESTEPSKSSLGAIAPFTEGLAREMAQKAIFLAHETGNLSEAADLLEEACNKWPELRDEYEYRIKIWRKGLIL